MRILPAARLLLATTESKIAVTALIAIFSHLLIRLIGGDEFAATLPLLISLLTGGFLVIFDLLKKLIRFEFAADLIAGLAIISAVFLGEHLAANLVILMLTGGEALEKLAVRRASFALDALLSRMPSNAHRREGDEIRDVPLSDVRPGDHLTVFPHEICPVDGVVVEGQSRMDEAYLTGEPYVISKVKGSPVISGAVNGEGALTVRATSDASNSRYSRILSVVQETEKGRVRMRRLGDKLGAFYTPFAILVASMAWLLSGDSSRFLAVLVTATPCPLLIGIPVAVIGAVSLCAKRGIILRDASVLEHIQKCRCMILDKTGTLTYGRPSLTQIRLLSSRSEDEVLSLAGSLEQYSRHPLANALLDAVRHRELPLVPAGECREEPGRGLRGRVRDVEVEIIGRSHLSDAQRERLGHYPKESSLECMIVIDGELAALLSFHDAPRAESRSFIKHLLPFHNIDRVMIVSGDRESEVRRLADIVGVRTVHAGKSPEEKLAIVQQETARRMTLYVGDGINDAPALLAATVGIAMGTHNDVTTEAAGAVILEGSLTKVDELLHIGARMRRIALESAVGGIVLSIGAMIFAGFGLLTPVMGAVTQEAIDLFAVINALRAAIAPQVLSDADQGGRPELSEEVSGYTKPELRKVS